MANYYVRSAAAGAGTGADWANAYTTLAAALAVGAGAHTFWVADDHAETQAGNMALTSLGTAALPIRILCVNTHTTEPPTALATTATVTTTSTGTITFAGFAYCYGISFIQGSGNNSSTAMNFTNSSPLWWKLEKCLLRHASTGASAIIAIGTSAAAVDDALVEFVDTQLQFAAVGHLFIVRSKFRWTAPTGVQPLVVGTIPTTLFTPNNDAVGSAEIIGLDFSQLTSGKNLISLASTSSYDWKFVDCKLSAPSTSNLTTGSPSGQGGSRVQFINCADGDRNYDYSDFQYQGTITTDIGNYRTTPAGASDGTTTISRKLAASANARFESPLYSDWIEVWNETVGSAVVVTVGVLTDNVTLTNAEAWIEVEGLNTSGFPLGGLILTDRAADIMATPANQTTDATSVWVDTVATPIQQSLSASITPQEKGILRFRVALAKASTTMYFDPLAVLS